MGLYNILENQMARLEFNSNIIAGIKDKNNVYRHVSQGYTELFKYPTPEKVQGLDEQAICQYIFQSELYSPQEIAATLIATDEQVLRGNLLYIFEIFMVHNNLTAFITHKSPHMSNDKITGITFHLLPIPKLTKNIIRAYITNPAIIVSEQTKSYLNTMDLYPSQKYPLTHRELECIHFLTKGASASDIAHTLGLSKRTIDFYIRNIKNKLNVRKTTEIIITALTDGIVDVMSLN